MNRRCMRGLFLFFDPVILDVEKEKMIIFGENNRFLFFV